MTTVVSAKSPEEFETTAGAAAAFLWTAHRAQVWDPVKDGEDGCRVHDMVMAKARSLWPWLDDAADQYERETSGMTLVEASESQGDTWEREGEW